jgi:hypothetical protein
MLCSKDKLNTKNSPVFIVGAPRSGTTLVASILNGSPELVVSPESHYFEKFFSICNRRHCFESDKSYLSYLEYFLNSSEIKTFGFSEEEKKILIDRLMVEKPSHAKIFSDVMTTYRKKFNKFRWAEKTPAHGLCVVEILSCFPDAKIVNIIRDPRDVMISRMKLPWRKTNVMLEAQLWNRYVTLDKSVGMLNNSNYYEIRYEDILKDHESEFRKLYEFLSLRFEQFFLDPIAAQGLLYNPLTEPWKDNVEKQVISNNVEKWKSEMPLHQRKVVWFITRSLLKEKGYEAGVDKLGWRGMLYFSYLIIPSFLLRARNSLEDYFKSPFP